MTDINRLAGPAAKERSLSRVLAAALATFVVAGLAGTLYRLGLAYGWTVGLDLINVRHAHSHLMYMGWATPALFVLVGERVVAASPKGRDASALRRIVIVSLVLGLSTFVPFLLFGYQSAELGSVRLPLSVVLSGFNMLAWYVFVGWYRRSARVNSLDSAARPLWDLATWMLVISTLGAWGLSLLKPLGVEEPVWSEMLKHLFLDVVSDGWMVLAVLGVAVHDVTAGAVKRGHWSTICIAAGIPVSFFVGMPGDLVPSELRLLAAAGSVLAVLGIGYHWLRLWPATSGSLAFWRMPLAFLAVKLVAQAAVAVVPDVSWAELHGLRVLYLHTMLLGFVTLGIVAGIIGPTMDAWRREWWLLLASVILLVGSLATLVIPVLSLESATWRVAAWVSLGPVLVLAWMAVRVTVGPSRLSRIGST